MKQKTPVDTALSKGIILFKNLREKGHPGHMRKPQF